MKFGSFDTESNTMDFLYDLMTADKTFTVFSANGKYRQFMSYNRYVKPGYLKDLGWNDVPGTYLLGDVNLDGKVSAADARSALRIASRLDAYPDAGSVVFMNADVNGNGQITAADARIILRVSAGLSSFDEFQNVTDTDTASKA